MKTILSFLLVAASLYACKNKKTDSLEKNAATTENAAAPDTQQSKSLSETMTGRYGIKSARVVTETELPNKMGLSTATLYFDDYGALSFTETVTKLNMKGVPASPKEFSISKDEYIYSWKEGEKTGSKINPSGIRDMKNMDFEKLGEAMLKELNIKKGGTETFLGKTCDVMEMNSPTLGKGKVLTWKNISMLSDMVTMGMKVRSEVKELEENPSINREKFELPAGVTFKDMDFNFKNDEE